MKNKNVGTSSARLKITNKIKIIIAVCILLLLLLIILFANRSKLFKTNKLANNEYSVTINTTTIDISQITTNEPNTPILGAGMIPIRWNKLDNVWEITTKDDAQWYNYSTGNLPTVMLSDGYYKSEDEVGITQNQIASNNPIGTPIHDEDLGSIFTWVPRLMYKEDRIEYLKDTCMLEYEWTTPSCFTYYQRGANKKDLAFTGMWVSNKTTEYINNAEDNKYGLIRNEIVSGITAEELTVVQKLNEKIGNTTTLSDANPIQTIKVVKTDKLAKITTQHKIMQDGIELQVLHHENNLKMILDKDGNALSLDAEGKTKVALYDEGDEYTFYIIDTEGNIRKHNLRYAPPGRPNLSGFNPNTTFYVTYDASGNEESIIPIGEKKPQTGWYDYENQMWANIVTRNNGDEAYFVWIPRYMYKLNQETQRSDVKFVDTDNNYTDMETGKVYSLNNKGYILPEAFSWNGKELKGYWMSKYELGDTSTYKAEIAGGSGVIRVKNVIANLGTGYTYEMYLIKDGKRIVWNDTTGGYEEGTTPITLTSNNYTFTNLEEGKYAVHIVLRNSSGKFIKAIGNEVTVLEPAEPEKPNLDGFDKNNTFYVTYDSSGNETSVIPIGEDAPTNWYNYDNQMWANIVTRNNGQEAYFVWIPRYEYKVDATNQRTNTIFIPKTKTTADSGYIIPEAFTWNNRELAGYWMSKYELGEGQTSLTAAIASGFDTIRISNIVNKTTKTIATYEAYLIKDGVRVAGPVTVNGEYTFTGVEYGKYNVHLVGKEASGNQVISLTKPVELQELETPNVTGYNVDTTYIVTYDEAGNANETQTLRDVLKDDANINSNGALISGSVDLSKIAQGRIWYNYAKQIWPNIVTRNNNQEAYFVWIPRYEYLLDEINQRSRVILIPKTKTSADSGYIIPEAFTWNGRQLAGYWMSKYELGA